MLDVPLRQTRNGVLLYKRNISVAAKTFRNLRRSEGNFHKVFLVVSKVQNEFEFCECLEGKQKVK